MNEADIMDAWVSSSSSIATLEYDLYFYLDFDSRRY